MPVYAWETVAAVTGEQAAFVAFLKATVGGKLREAHGPVSLQQLKFTPLFRLIIHRPDGRIEHVFSLPVDEAWSVCYGPVKGRSTAKAIRVTIDLSVQGVEGFEQLVVFLPYDGDGGSAILFAQACVHASKEVEKNVVALMEAAMEKANIAAKKSDEKDFGFETDDSDGDDNDC